MSTGNYGRVHHVLTYFLYFWTFLKFTCVEECPDSYPVKMTDDYNRVKETICTTPDYLESLGGEQRYVKL